MSILDYTSYDEVRAALGVSDDELEDVTLALPIYEDRLLADLEDIGADLNALYLATKDVAEPAADQVRFLRSARLFANYALAKALTGTLPMFGPKSIEDGKARMERFADPYKETVRSINSEYEKWRARLQQAYSTLGQPSSGSTRRPYFAVVSPASDPITGT
jgi:hypothetical protein